MNQAAAIKALQHFEQSTSVFEKAMQALPPAIADATDACVTALVSGNKILTCGNGGSAGDAMHLASELVNRFNMERPALPAIALTTDSLILTSIANDYDYDRIFARQIQALGQEGDVLIAISTSGNSKNVIAAVSAAKERNMQIVVLSGRDGGLFNQVLEEQDIEIRAPSDTTARIQEVHLVVIHAIADAIDNALFGSNENIT